MVLDKAASFREQMQHSPAPTLSLLVGGQCWYTCPCSSCFSGQFVSMLKFIWMGIEIHLGTQWFLTRQPAFLSKCNTRLPPLWACQLAVNASMCVHILRSIRVSAEVHLGWCWNSHGDAMILDKAASFPKQMQLKMQSFLTKQPAFLVQHSPVRTLALLVGGQCINTCPCSIWFSGQYNAEVHLGRYWNSHGNAMSLAFFHCFSTCAALNSDYSLVLCAVGTPSWVGQLRMPFPIVSRGQDVNTKLGLHNCFHQRGCCSSVRVWVPCQLFGVSFL